MPYNKQRKKCKQSDGTPGSYVLSYTDDKGKKHQACHTSKKKMQGQIAAIEADPATIDEEECAKDKFALTVVTESTLRTLIREMLQSHTVEPMVGDQVVNVNPGCKHYGSEGVVVRLEQLPQDMGTVACYKCMNNGVSWSEGDILRKSLDQLELS